MMNLRGYLEKHLVTVDFPPTFFTTNFPVAASIFDSISLSLCLCAAIAGQCSTYFDSYW